MSSEHITESSLDPDGDPVGGDIFVFDDADLSPAFPVVILPGGTSQTKTYLLNLKDSTGFYLRNITTRIKAADVISENIDNISDPNNILNGSPTFVTANDGNSLNIRAVEYSVVSSGPASGSQATITVTINTMTFILVVQFDGE